MAQGQFGPPLAGTTLSFEQVQRQVRSPRDKMPAFSSDTVSDQDLSDIYQWLTSLPPPATSAAGLPPSEATRQAREQRFPEFDATTLLERMEVLDEVALRLHAEVVGVEAQGRYNEVRLRMIPDGATVEVLGIYDTVLLREAFPAPEGAEVTVYGVGATPAEIIEDGETHRVPRLQILYVEIR